MKGVITADIINSTKIDITHRDLLLKTLQHITDDLKRKFTLQIEIYRGDSFQVLIDDAIHGMLCAVLIRAGLMYLAPEKEKWDARLSLGIGNVQYENKHITMSDGDAFRLSGRNFEDIGKRKLIATTTSQQINDDLTLICAFADDVISNWSKKQAELMYKVLLDNTNRKDLAKTYGTSTQNIGKTLRAAKENLITMFLKRYESLIKNL